MEQRVGWDSQREKEKKYRPIHPVHRLDPELALPLRRDNDKLLLRELVDVDWQPQSY